MLDLKKVEATFEEIMIMLNQLADVIRRATDGMSAAARGAPAIEYVMGQLERARNNAANVGDLVMDLARLLVPRNR